MTRITEKDYAALTGKKTPRDSSHEKSLPGCEPDPDHAHYGEGGVGWQITSFAVLCSECEKEVKMMAWFNDGKSWRCLDCARCQCGKTARQLWEAANKR